MRRLIDTVASRLAWEVRHEQSASPELQIISDPWARRHTIHIPSGGVDWRDIEYLHELAHAYLAERCHHLLGTAWFARQLPQAILRRLTPPLRCADDWYADALLMRRCPAEERAEIEEHAGYILALHRRSPRGDDELLYGGGLILAQAVKYAAYRPHDVPRRYRRAVEILLACNPDRPSVEAKRRLVNALLALTCDLRLSLAVREGVEVWDIMGK
jgi:hypothetical protein